MTKLQLLHRALNERLMAAVEQIMEMVGGTVLEYEEETVRARRENEILRRRLRWMEGEIPTDWPDEVDLPGPEQPISFVDVPVQECLTVKTEPTDAFDSQSFRPDVSLTASVLAAELQTVDPGTSEPADASVPAGTVWDSTQNYMAPLDFDPTTVRGWRGRGRSQRMSFACPDCGKVFGREQRLMFHMRIHSAERPYTYRRRKVCFYGEKKRKKKLRGLSKVYPSKEFIDDLSDSSEQTERSAGSTNTSAPTAVTPRVPVSELRKESNEARKDTGNNKYPENSAAKTVSHKSRTGQVNSKTPRCLECKKVFKTVSKLAMHMKTHRKQFPSQEEQKEQEDTDKRPRQYRKKPVMRNNETEVERARAGGHSLFQCLECKKIYARSCWLAFHLKSHDRERTLACKERKKLLSNKMQKSVSTEDNAKETAAENSSVFKKIFACPYCDKVFTREGWLGPHIRSHTVPTPRKEVHNLQRILPGPLKKKARRSVGVSRLPKAGLNKRKRVTEELNGKSETGSEQLAKIQETSQITLGSERDSQSKTTSADSERIIDGSSEITEESHILPGESTGEGGGVKRSKKTYPCRVCGKIYLHAGWLKIHKKIHRAEKMHEENRRRRMMEELEKKERETDEQCLTEKIMDNIVEKKQKKRKRLIKMQHSLDKGKAKNQDTAGMPSNDNGDTSSGIQASEAKNEVPPKKKNASCVCSHCGKVYARRNWLKMHMLGHRKPTPQTKVNEENAQIPQEHSSTERPTVPKGKDGGKASYPCPFCDKVFRRGMRLMVHMQIHSGEKPYSYRERKEQFYGDLTRARVPDTYSQEPAIESNDEREKDGRFTVTRHQTSAVSQDQTSTTEPMETVEPHSVCTGRKFSLLPLQSAGAASNHSLNHPGTHLESVSGAMSLFSLQPRIVLEPIVAGSKSWASPADDDFRSVKANTSDHELRLISDAKTVDATANVDYPGKRHIPQTPPENANTCYDSKNVLSDINIIVVSDTHDPDIVYTNLGSDVQSHEDTAHPEIMLISIGDQHTAEPPEGRMFCPRDGQENNLGYSSLNVKQTTDRSKAELGAEDVAPFWNTSSIKSSCDGNFDDRLQTTAPGFILSESSSTAKQQIGDPESVCVIPSKCDSDHDDDHNYDDTCSNVSDNQPQKKITRSKNKTGQLGVKGDATSHPAPNRFHSSSQKATGAASHVEFILDQAEELNACDGLLSKKDELVNTSKQKKNSKGQKSSSACMICGLVFASNVSLSRHMRVHSGSQRICKKSSAVTTSIQQKKKNSKGQKSSSACMICGLVFASNVSLSRHMRVHSSSRRIGKKSSVVTASIQQTKKNSKGQESSSKCLICGLIFAGRVSLSQHMRVHSSSGRIGKKSSVVTASIQQTKKNSKGQESSSTCLICGLIFAGRVSLSQHMRVHSSSGRIGKKSSVVTASIQQTKKNSKGQESSSTCLICGLIFAGKLSLSRHMRVHSSSGHIGKKSSAFNSETKDKQEVFHVQASEVRRDDSTDNSEILGKSDSATEMEAKPTKSSVVHTATRSPSSKGALKTSTKGKQLKEGRSAVYCRFCSKACRKIELHLKYDHPREPEVIEAFHCSKTSEERKKLLSHLCSKKTSESDNTVVDEDLVHCLFCQGSYQRNQFWKHALICEPKEPKWELTQTEAASSVHTPNAHLKTRPNIAQKTFDPESDYLVQDNIYNTAQQTPAESLNDPLPNVDSSTLPKTSVVPESTETIPSTTEKIPIPYIAKHITKNPDNKLSSLPPVDSSLYHSSLLGGSDLEKKTDQDLPSSDNLDCSAESVILPELLDCVNHNSQLTSDLNSQRTTMPTPDSSDLQQTFCCSAESEQIALSDSDKHDPDSESTYFLVPDHFSSDVQKADTERGNTSIHVFDNSENRAPTLQVGCSTVKDCIPATTKHNPDPHSDVAYNAALGMFDSESYIKEDMDKIGADTGHGSDVRSVGSDGLVLKRKWDRQSSMFIEAKTKKMRQIDPSQPMRVDTILSDEEENLKVHTCQHCSATFCSPYHLRRHVYTHTGERPFWCSLCNLGFIQKYRFRNHRMTHHRDTQSRFDQHIRKKRKTRSDSGDKPVLNELPEQSFSESPAASSEPSSSIEEKTTSTSRDAKDVKLTADNQFVTC